jgi:hypothetical protein
MSVLKKLKEGPPSPRPPHNLPRKEPAKSPRPPPLRISQLLHRRIFQPRWKIPTLLFGPRNWTLCSKKRRIRNLRISKSFYFSMFDPPSILEDLKFLGYYTITLHQRGIAFYATKDYTEGTLAKIVQFLRSFQGMYFPSSI